MGMRGSKRGSMPFAVIAVTLLLLAGTYASVCAYIERERDNIDNINTELDAFDRSVREFGDAVNRGIGGIVADVGRSDTGGLPEAEEEFLRRTEAWMGFVFPMTNGVVVARLLSFDVAMTARSLSMGTADGNVSRPVLLGASGVVTVSMTSASGSAVKDIAVDADASSALPFLMEQTTLFKFAAEGEMSLMHNLIAYQLSSVAQYRVLQGFGALNEHGGRGTADILTEGDVREAFRSAVSVCRAIYFRDGGMASRHALDLGELMISEDGCIELDLRTVYSQAAASIIDDLVVQWLDYFMTDRILEYIDWMLDRAEYLSDRLRDALASIARLFGRQGAGAVTAGTYLRDIMEAAGVDEEDYRYCMSGSSAVIETVPFERRYGADTVSVPSLRVTVRYPDVDIVGWEGWNGFMQEYRNGRNILAGSLRSILNSVCQGIACGGSGTVRLPVDPYDDRDLCASLLDALNASLNAQMAEAVRIASDIAADRILDPLSASIFKTLEGGRDGAFGHSAFEEGIRTAVLDSTGSYLAGEYGGTMLDQAFIEDAVENTMSSDAVRAVISQYRRTADRALETIGRVLNSKVSDADAMSRIISVIVSRNLMTKDVHAAVAGRMVPLVEEMLSHIRMTSVGMQRMPGTRSFTGFDSLGDPYEQTVRVSVEDDIAVRIAAPWDHPGLNGHLLNFLEDDRKVSSYTSVFTVDISGTVAYTAVSSSFASSSMGTFDSVHSDTAEIGFRILVPVMSAWGLAGVGYQDSRNILDDLADGLWDALMHVFGPLLGPLRELYRLMNVSFTMIRTSLIQISGYVNDVVTRMFEEVSAAMERMQDALEAGLSRIFGSVEALISMNFGCQEFGIRFHEFELRVRMNVRDIVFSNKTVLGIAFSMPLGDTEMEAGFDIKRNDRGDYSVSGRASFVSGDWSLELKADPFMRSGRHIIEITGSVRGTDVRITIPELIQYDVLEFRLSDVPGLGAALSNIPLPIPGMKGSIDAGVQMKYGAPYRHGLVINEFESNPQGGDAGKEWVELYNSSRGSIDLDGFKLVPGSGEDKAYVIRGVGIAPGEHLVITLPGRMLNNTAGRNGNGDRIVLLDADDNEVDKTPWKADTKDDGDSWQRETDGSTKWVFKKNTRGGPNGGKLAGGGHVRSMLQRCVIEAGAEAFREAGNITDADGISGLLERTVVLTVEKAIGNIAGCVVEASVFIELGFTDLTGSGHTGVRVSLLVGSEMVEAGLRWIAGEVFGLMRNVANPSALDPRTAVMENTFLQVTAYTGISTPRILRSGADVGLTAGVVAEWNLSAVCTLLGKERGDWSAGVGIRIEDVPPEVIPKALKADKDRHADLWLVRAEFGRSPG